jgi:hypothetical protein
MRASAVRTRQDPLLRNFAISRAFYSVEDYDRPVIQPCALEERHGSHLCRIALTQRRVPSSWNAKCSSAKIQRSRICVLWILPARREPGGDDLLNTRQVRILPGVRTVLRALLLPSWIGPPCAIQGSASGNAVLRSGVPSRSRFSLFATLSNNMTAVRKSLRNLRDFEIAVKQASNRASFSPASTRQKSLRSNNPSQSSSPLPLPIRISPTSNQLRAKSIF